MSCAEIHPVKKAGSFKKGTGGTAEIRKTGGCQKKASVMRGAAGIFFVLVFSSCGSELLPELEVKSCSYDSGKISVEFSSEPERNSVQKSFCLKEDEKTVEGTFSFSGKKVCFFPEEGIRQNYDYDFSIATSCEDTEGRSLMEKFVKKFSTRSEKICPQIISIKPENEEILRQTGAVPGAEENIPEGIEIHFSEKIHRESFEEAFSITPAIDFLLDFFDEDRAVKIIPQKSLAVNTDYKISVSTKLMDLSRNCLEEDFTSVFSMFRKRDCSSVTVSVAGETKNVFPAEFSGLSSDCTVRFDFDEKMNLDLTGSCITVFPEVSYSVKKDEFFSKWLEISFENIEWGTICRLSVSETLTDCYSNPLDGEKITRLRFDSESHRPPELEWGCIQTGNWEKDSFLETDWGIFSREKNYGYLVFDPEIFEADVEKEALMFLIFSSSEVENNSGINIYSLMDKISFAVTNGCGEFSIEKMKICPEGLENLVLKKIFQGQAVDFSERGKLTVVQCTLKVKNSLFSGIVELQVEEGFLDSLGNKALKSWGFKFNK